MEPTTASNLESANEPLLTESRLDHRPGIFSRLLTKFWNSCTCCGLAGSVCLTSAVIAVKLLTTHASAFQIAFVRSSIALPIFVSVGYFQTGFIVGPKNQVGWIALRGFFASVAFILAALSTQLLALSEASLLTNSHPALLVFLLWVFGLESMDWISWIGVLGTLISQALIAQPPFIFGHRTDWNFQKYLGLLCSFGAVTSVSIGLMIVGIIGKKVPSIVIANYAGIQSMIVSLPFLLIGFPKAVDWHPSPRDILLYLVTAFSQLNQLFIVRSFQIGPPVKATMISLTRVVMMMLAGAVLLGEVIGLMHAIGALMMFASICLVIWNRERRDKSYRGVDGRRRRSLMSV